MPWLKQELESKGFDVTVPAMPDTETPTIEAWVPYLANLAGEPDQDTYFVGHSVGCQTILRYLESLPEGIKVGGLVFVAPWLLLTNLDDEEQQVISAWVETPLDYGKIKRHFTNLTAIFSDNDEFVSLENKVHFEDMLGAKTVVESSKEHFDQSSGITELPSALEAVLEISGN